MKGSRNISGMRWVEYLEKQWHSEASGGMEYPSGKGGEDLGALHLENFVKSDLCKRYFMHF